MGVVSICKVAANSQEACGCPQAPNINIATWLLTIQYQKILHFYHYLSFGPRRAERAQMRCDFICQNLAAVIGFSIKERFLRFQLLFSGLLSLPSCYLENEVGKKA